MIGVDTNVLLRHTLADDARQSPVASGLLTSGGSGREHIVVNPVVLVEFVWTLLRRERFEKVDVLALLDTLSASDRIVFAQEGVIMSAIEAWRAGRADFQDYLIAALNLQAGARTTVTFDATAAGEPGFTLLPS